MDQIEKENQEDLRNFDIVLTTYGIRIFQHEKKSQKFQNKQIVELSKKVCWRSFLTKKTAWNEAIINNYFSVFVC